MGIQLRMDTDEPNAAFGRNHRFWTAAGSEAPRRFWKQPSARKAVSPLRSATAVQIFIVRARSCRIVLRIFARKRRRRAIFVESHIKQIPAPAERHQRYAAPDGAFLF